MDPYQISKQKWDTLAPWYELNIMPLTIYNQSYDDFLRRLNKPNAAILELGCGPGNISKYLLQKNPRLQIMGIDNAESMVAMAKQHCPGAEFLCMDVRQIEQINKKFDGLVAGFCLPYLSIGDVEKILLDAKNLLNPDGQLYLSFIEGDYAASGLRQNKLGQSSLQFYYTLEQLMPYFNKNGFRNIIESRIQYMKADGSEEHHLILMTSL